MRKRLVRFASAGIPIQCEGGNLEAVQCSRDLGLGAFELEFVRGVKMKEGTAREIAASARKNDVLISSHAPYYINCCTQEKAKVAGTIRHIFSSAQATGWCGGTITVFHPGYYQKLSKEEAFQAAKKVLLMVKEKMDAQKVKCILGAETVGKKSAFGGLGEVIRLHEELGFVWPVLDFAHLLARGDLPCKTEEDYRKLFDMVEKKVKGYGKDFHSHFSSIKYGEKGERNHLPISANVPPYKPLMKMLAENGISGRVVCESPRLEYDALIMQKEYLKHL
ncbi:MAG: TIM barrel protein [Candidatus ainarchaeum sp.]|nr:TIM barrel protein [Candidatus ainarchaeum sp.]